MKDKTLLELIVLVVEVFKITMNAIFITLSLHAKHKMCTSAQGAISAN